MLLWPWSGSAFVLAVSSVGSSSSPYPKRKRLWSIACLDCTRGWFARAGRGLVWTWDRKTKKYRICCLLADSPKWRHALGTRVGIVAYSWLRPFLCICALLIIVCKIQINPRNHCHAQTVSSGWDLPPPAFRSQKPCSIRIDLSRLFCWSWNPRKSRSISKWNRSFAAVSCCLGSFTSLGRQYSLAEVKACLEW